MRLIGLAVILTVGLTHTLLAADIKRFLDRPAETMHVMPPPDAPPGAPIGDMPFDWLATPPWR